MVNRFYWVVSTILCCSLLLNSGCQSGSSDEQENPQESNRKSGSDAKGTVEVDDKKDAGEPPVVSGDIPPPIPPAPGPVPIPVGDGFGGGSQGAEKPADTGNPDRKDHGPNGVCGNGEQEVLANNNQCPFDIYGTTSDGPDGPSYLVGFDLENDGIGYTLGQIGPGLQRVTDVDFSPDGVLYGVAEDGMNQSILITINCRTGAAAVVGATGIDSNGDNDVITDIAFDALGRLFAYVKFQNNADELGILAPTTGAYTSLGITGLEDNGNGIGARPFPFDTLYHTGSSLSNLDRTTGLANTFSGLNFVAPADDNPRINGLDADPFTNVMYASINDDNDENYLGILDTATGDVSFLRNPPLEAPDGLDGIAVNRRYEECDPASEEPLPAGTGCSEDCHFVEITCNDREEEEDMIPLLQPEDGIDNDQDGLANCDDPDCAMQPCTDTDGCTENDTCLPVTCPANSTCVTAEAYQCIGSAVVCNDGNECTSDSCQEVDDETYKCNLTLNTNKVLFGSCTPQDNCEGDDDDGERNEDGSCPQEQVTDLCLVGRCVESNEGPIPFVFCEEAAKDLALVEEGGCLDDNPCTGDICLDETGECDYAILDGISCVDDNVCTIGDTCIQGVCGVAAPTICTNDIDCGPGGDCVLANNAPVSFCVCDDGNECTGFNFLNNQDQCNQGACGGFDLADGSSCDDGNECTTPDTCLNGQCGNGLIPNSEPCEDDENPCTEPVCTEAGCHSIIMDGPMVCFNGPCEGRLQCNQGEAVSNCVPLDPQCLDI